MNILYDYQIFDMQVTGGISRYHADLYNGCKNKGIETILGLKYTSNIYLEREQKFKKSYSSEDVFLRGLNFKNKNLLYKAFAKMGVQPKSSFHLNAEFCRKCIANENYDIFHPTFYDDIYKDVQIHAPIVLTIHDMIYESYPQFFSDMSIINRKKKMVERASAIIAISEFTKNEILHYYDFIDESKIHVVYHGIDLSGIDNVCIKKAKENYILYVGDRWLYKDFYTLLRSMKLLKNNKVDLKLITVGRSFSGNELTYIDFLGLNNDVVNLGRVSDEKLNILYSNAMLYISTSMCEGFGLPLLECMKYGTPMLLSDIPVYREIAGDAAIYFKTGDDKSLADSIREIYSNQRMLDSLIVKGRKKILEFEMKTMVDNTINVYKNVVQ